MNLLAQAASAIKPVSLMKGEEAAAASAQPWPWLAIALISAGVLVVLGGLLAFRISRIDPAEKAFRLLAFRLGLGRRERAAVRRLADTIQESKPVVLLVCGDALERAISRLTPGAGPGLDAKVIRRIRERVIG